MFLHLSIILFTAGGGGSALGGRGSSLEADGTALGGSGLHAELPLRRQTPQNTVNREYAVNTVNTRSVRILLECILVLNILTDKPSFGSLNRRIFVL